MDDMGRIIGDMFRRIQIEPRDGDYEQDGLIYCGKCNTPRQTVTMFGEESVAVPVMCKCRAEEVERQRIEDERREFDERVKAARRAAIADDELRGWTFDVDDRQRPKVSDAMRRYAANFDQMKADNVGLLIYGPVGTGKTFYAACIVNYLCKAGRRALMTSFVKIVNGIPSGFDDEKQRYFDQFQRFDLLVIDDLGAERQSDYMLEQVYNIVDARYRSGRPIIITTNLDLDSIRKPADVRYSRIYDRVLEMCHPVFVDGPSRRKAAANGRFDKMNKMLGL